MRIITTMLLTFIFLIGIAISPIFVNDSLAAVSCECTGSISPKGLVASILSTALSGDLKKGCEQSGGTYNDSTCHNAKVVVSTKSKEECEKMTVAALAKAVGLDLNMTVNQATKTSVPIFGTNKIGEYINVKGSCAVKSGSDSATGGSNSTAPTGGKGSCTSEKCTLSNPLGNVTEVPVLIGTIIKGVLGIVGALALFFFFQGGFSWMTSAGNPERVKKGKDTIMWSSIGLVATFASYALLKFILDMLTK